jgi:signal transduction histidine kinase
MVSSLLIHRLRPWANATAMRDPCGGRSVGGQHRQVTGRHRAVTSAGELVTEMDRIAARLRWPAACLAVTALVFRRLRHEVYDAMQPTAVPPALANVLAVDDDPRSLLAMEALLAPLRHRVLTAPSGEAALAVLEDHDVAVVLLDVKMAGLDGFETARRMRQRERTRLTPIIFVTAAAPEPSLIANAYAQGAVDYLVKPFDLHIMRSKVQVFIDLFLLREQVRHLSSVDAARRAAERERENQMQWFHALLDQMPTPFVLLEPGTARVLFANKEADRLADGSFAAGRPAECDAALRAAACGEELRGRELEWPKGGESLALTVDSFTLPAMFDRAPTVLTSLHDVTAIKRAERERERVRELFVGMLSHDLRGPLSAIMIGSALLLKRPADFSDSTARVLSRIAHCAERMRRMISDLLDFTRTRFGNRIPIQRRDADLAQICRDAVGELAIAHVGRSVEVATDGDLRGSWDPDRLAEVVQNLVGNALEHSEESSAVTVRVSGDGELVRLEVHNSGEPIATDLLPEIFEPFRQGAVANPAGDNLGLGLYIAREIVCGHGGSVAVRSNPEEGTRFTVELPRGVAAGGAAAT